MIVQKQAECSLQENVVGKNRKTAVERPNGSYRVDQICDNNFQKLLIVIDLKQRSPILRCTAKAVIHYHKLGTHLDNNHYYYSMTF